MPGIRKTMNNMKPDITRWYMTWTCVYVYAILHVLTQADIHLQQPVFAENHDLPLKPHIPTIKRTLPWPNKGRGTKMTAALHFLWGLSPMCLCASAKPSHCSFKVHLVSLSWLGSFSLKYLPSSLPVPLVLASACPDSSLCDALLLYCFSQTSLPPLLCYCFSCSVHSRQRGKSVFVRLTIASAA